MWFINPEKKKVMLTYKMLVNDITFYLKDWRLNA